MSITQTKLYGLLNARVSPSVPFSPQNTELVNVVADSGATWNSRMTLRALPGQGYSGSTPVLYRRIDLAAMGLPEFSLGQVTSHQAMLDALNSRYGSWLTMSDIDVDAIGTDEGIDQTITMTARPNNFAWIGTVQIVLKTALEMDPAEIEVLDATFEPLSPVVVSIGDGVFGAVPPEDAGFQLESIVFNSPEDGEVIWFEDSAEPYILATGTYLALTGTKTRDLAANNETAVLQVQRTTSPGYWTNVTGSVTYDEDGFLFVDDHYELLGKPPSHISEITTTILYRIAIYDSEQRLVALSPEQQIHVNAAANPAVIGIAYGEVGSEISVDYSQDRELPHAIGSYSSSRLAIRGKLIRPIPEGGELVLESRHGIYAQFVRSNGTLTVDPVTGEFIYEDDFYELAGIPLTQSSSSTTSVMFWLKITHPDEQSNVPNSGFFSYDLALAA